MALALFASRCRYFVGTDPDGCFVAEEAGNLVGLAVSHIRGDLFVLANLGVAPAVQEQGVGRELLARALEYGAATSRGLICSSPDPRALRRYVRAGFELSPAMDAQGRPSAASDVQLGIRPSDGNSKDLALVDELDLRVRSAGRRSDVAYILQLGPKLWIDGEGGYALVGERDVLALCAADESIGHRMLAALLASGATGTSVTASWLTSSTPWAIEAAVDARAALKPHGAVMTRGDLRFAGAYLPNAIFG